MKIEGRKIYSCSCGSNEHFLVIDTWQDEDDPKSNTILVMLLLRPHGFLTRLKVAWRILQGQEYEYHDLILNLDEFERFVMDMNVIRNTFAKNK